MALLVKGLKVKIGNKEVLGGVGLAVARGEVVALMGPNGCGKSTLALALMGHPSYEITDGSVDLDGGDMTTATPDARSRAGLFLAVQYPVSIPGVSVREALLASLRARGGAGSAFGGERGVEGGGE